jgi:ribonuclease HI
LWLARNGAKNGEPMKHPHAVVQQVKAYVEMIELHLYDPNPSTRRDSNSFRARWSPPPEGTVCVNVDAALFASSRQMGIGVVIRNHRGDCLTACSELHNEVTAPEIAEALACRRAVSLAVEEGFDKIIVVSDCLSLIHRLQSLELDRSMVGLVVQDIKHICTCFAEVSFMHALRQCNEAAHVLARSAERFVSCTFRLSAPECIRKTLCNDLL